MLKSTRSKNYTVLSICILEKYLLCYLTKFKFKLRPEKKLETILSLRKGVLSHTEKGVIDHRRLIAWIASQIIKNIGQIAAR